MKPFFSTLVLLTFFWSSISAQRLSQFSENRNEFIKELHGYMTAGKRKTMEDIYDDFEKIFKSGVFSEGEVQQILKTGNSMLGQRMTASPYFSEYLRTLTIIKNDENGETRFQKWHGVLDSILINIENRRLKPYQTFLKFSHSFFVNNALRLSKSGTSWIVDAPRYELRYENKAPFIEFEKLNLIASRGKDSIVIIGTSGIFDPVEQVWKGNGGKVTWERFGLEKEVYAVLADYELEIKNSLYTAKGAKLHYPLYFGENLVEGKFTDKVSTQTKANQGSYPRFESKEEVLEVKNFGNGITYNGGFRLHGTTVYGFGSKNNKAKITIFNDDNDLVYKALAELFTIRRGERIAGERVESTLYFEQDSIFHPSVNLRFEIPTRDLKLSRGQRGSDRNPFYNSLHQLNIDADRIEFPMSTDSIFIGKRNLGFQKTAVPIVFESLKYFEESDYQRIQNIATTNPIALMKIVYEETGERILDANMLAQELNPRFTVENISSLLYDLVSKGFINYDADDQKVELKDKIFHYADASQKKVDYDVLRVSSETSETNAILSIKDKTIETQGVNSMTLSVSQKVGFLPFGEQVKILPNRDMDFDGKVFAGFTTFFGKDYHFKYDKFHIGLDSVRFFDLFVPTGNLTKKGAPEALRLGSRIEHLSGVLLVDAPSNKSGRDKIAMFPSLQSKDNSYVFYDYKNTQGGAYTRDSFYFKLDPFSFNSLDRFLKEEVKFDGTMFSSNIFPLFEETLVIQDDQSLGFITDTPDDGYPSFQDKGNFKGKVSLSNEGFQGNGKLSYLGAEIDSEDLIFKPKQMTGSADRFDLEEDRDSEVEVPQVRGVDVKIDWRPYKDSMYIRSKEAPFDLFKEGQHTLKGLLILTPGGLKGRGDLDWGKAVMSSNLFSFDAFAAKADTTDLRIRAFDADALALKTSNLNGIADFDEQMGRFKANAEFLTTTLPYNQYETSFNEFDWDMKEETVTFKALEGKLGRFLSIHPDQDSLRFQGKSAFYDLKTNLLKIGGVPFIITSDAFVYPETGDVEIQPGGVMTKLDNARIIADTINQYHVINKASVRVLGRKEYRASGFYEYNIGKRQQEIEFAEIIGTRVGKGTRSDKASVTRATGEVTPRDNFYIDHKTEFRGTISLSAEKPNLAFDGFARFESKTLPSRHWFSLSCEADKNDLAIPYKVPKNYQGEALHTGLFLSKETTTVYPRVMMPLFFRKDRPLLPVQGIVQYDEALDKFIFEDSLKAMTPNAIKGNELIYHNTTGKIDMKGSFNIASGLNPKHIKVDAAGKAGTKFGELVVDTVMNTSAMESSLQAEFIAGIKFAFPDNLLKIIQNDFKSSVFEANPINLSKDFTFYKEAVANLFPDNEDTKKSIQAIAVNNMSLPKKDNNYTFLIGSLPMAWDKDLQSFISTKTKNGLMSINGEIINCQITSYIEFQMPTNDDDRVYIYLKSPSTFYYYFGYKQNKLEVISNNSRFNEAVATMKEKEKIFKMDDGTTYEIFQGLPAKASNFENRIKAAKEKFK